VTKHEAQEFRKRLALGHDLLHARKLTLIFKAEPGSVRAFEMHAQGQMAKTICLPAFD
jgi:hypothetical protein